MMECSGEGVESVGDGGSNAPPIPQESHSLPLRDSWGRESLPKQGRGKG